MSFESKTISVNDPGAPKEQLDTTLAPGTRKQVQSAHTGLKSELWKVVTVDGVETERTLLNKDTYMASKAIVLVGPELPAETVPAETTPIPGDAGTSETPSSEIPSAPVEGANGGPGVSAPAQTPSVSPSPGIAAGPSVVSPSPAGSSPVSEIPASPAA